MQWIKGADRLPGLFTKVKWRNADGGNIPLPDATPLEHYQRAGANINWHEWLDESVPVDAGEQSAEHWQQKYKDANQFICDIAKLLGQDGLGYDDLTWTLEDFKDAIESYRQVPVQNIPIIKGDKFDATRCPYEQIIENYFGIKLLKVPQEIKTDDHILTDLVCTAFQEFERLQIKDDNSTTYKIFKNDKVNSILAAAMQSLSPKQLSVLRDCLIERTPLQEGKDIQEGDDNLSTIEVKSGLMEYYRKETGDTSMVGYPDWLEEIIVDLRNQQAPKQGYTKEDMEAAWTNGWHQHKNMAYDESNKTFEDFIAYPPTPGDLEANREQQRCQYEQLVEEYFGMKETPKEDTIFNVEYYNLVNLVCHAHQKLNKCDIEVLRHALSAAHVLKTITHTAHLELGYESSRDLENKLTELLKKIE